LVSEGDLLSANDATVVAKVKDSSRLYINFTESAAQVLQMRRDLAGGTLKRADGAEAAEVKIVLEDGSIFPSPGRLLFTDMSVDEGTGQVQLRAEVPNAQGLLLPGLFVKVRIEQSAIAHAVLLPQQAVTRGSQGDSVLVVNADGSFAPRSVQVQTSMGNEWAVTGGLADGEQVIVTGQMHLMPGVKKVQAQPYQGLEVAAAAANAASAAGAGKK
jgi:membrane fusion protein (multidrug efflux system)